MASEPTSGPRLLTPREQQVLELLTSGTPSPEIAARLEITPDTADDYVRNVYRKIGARPAQDGGPLTPREYQILTLLAAGNSTAAIADQLGIAPATVKTHLTSVYREIGAKNRVQAARYFLDQDEATQT